MTIDDGYYRATYKGVDYLFNHPLGWDVLRSDNPRERRRWARYVVWTLGDKWTMWSKIMGYRRTRLGAEKLARRVTLNLEYYRAEPHGSGEFENSRPFRFVYVTNLDDRNE